MLEIFNELRGVTTDAVALKLILAVLCGGAIGLEREQKRQPAGFRTHILICLGAATCTLISQYLAFVLHKSTDMARLGAQVVAGIGFIGAGTIIVTKRNRVHGLTTAAGLWVTAIIGLACGAGYYEGVLGTTLLVLAAEFIFAQLEHGMTRRQRFVLLRTENAETVTRILQRFDSLHIAVWDMEMSKSDADESCSTICSLKFSRQCSCEELLIMLPKMEGVLQVRQL